jgi:hypothetical protein
MAFAKNHYKYLLLFDIIKPKNSKTAGYYVAFNRGLLVDLLPN